VANHGLLGQLRGKVLSARLSIPLWAVNSHFCDIVAMPRFCPCPDGGMPRSLHSGMNCSDVVSIPGLRRSRTQEHERGSASGLQHSQLCFGPEEGWRTRAGRHRHNRRPSWSSQSRRSGCGKACCLLARSTRHNIGKFEASFSVLMSSAATVFIDERPPITRNTCSQSYPQLVRPILLWAILDHFWDIAAWVGLASRRSQGWGLSDRLSDTNAVS
jgi:hypothetical protein